MLFTLTLLRNKGKRLETLSPVHTDACLHTQIQSGFTCLTVSSYHGGPSHKVKPLFEPKIRLIDQYKIHLIGFESEPGGESFVQEWILETGSGGTLSRWGGRVPVATPAHSRLEKI